jgi:hypothetical protein
MPTKQKGLFFISKNRAEKSNRDGFEDVEPGICGADEASRDLGVPMDLLDIRLALMNK